MIEGKPDGESRRAHPKRLMNCSGQFPHSNGRFPSLPLTGVSMLSFLLSLTTSEMYTNPSTGAVRMLSGESPTEAFITARVQWERAGVGSIFSSPLPSLPCSFAVHHCQHGYSHNKIKYDQDSRSGMR